VALDMSKIAVHCAYDKMIETGKLVPNPANPNQHPEKQVTKLAALIKYHGWRHPITVSKKSGFIVSGHCRLQAAQALELKECPVDYQDFESEAEEYAVMIADNVVQEFAEIDGLKMADILAGLDKFNYPMELTALEPFQIEDYIDGFGMPTDEDWAAAFERNGDTSIVDDLQQITFVLQKDMMGKLIGYLKKLNKNKNEAIVKWLEMSLS